MIVTNKNQARWYKEISFRALPEQNVEDSLARISFKPTHEMNYSVLPVYASTPDLLNG